MRHHFINLCHSILLIIRFNILPKKNVLDFSNTVIYINYNDVPMKFKAWKNKMGYTNAQCAEILNLSIPTVKRLAHDKTKFK